VTHSDGRLLHGIGGCLNLRHQVRNQLIHANDLLAHLQLTTRAYVEVAKVVHELAHEVGDGRLIVFGGGGYNQANVARTWALVAAALSQGNLPNETPKTWRKLFETLVGEEAPINVSSEHEGRKELSSHVDREQIQASLAELKQRVDLLS
jgi:hypothetical protein